MAEARLDDKGSTVALLKLTNWLSPSFPVGAFSYSHGLEQAVAQGDIQDRTSAQAWLEDTLLHGAGRTDAIFLKEAWKAIAARDQQQLENVTELASVFFPSAERHLEAMAQGKAFLSVARDVWPDADMTHLDMPHAVAVGAYAGAHGAELETSMVLYLQAFTSNLIFAAIRLVPLGQTEGQKIISDMHPVIIALARDAMTADLNNVGGCTWMSDIAAMRHETLQPRIFRT